MRKTKERKSAAIKLLETIAGGPLTLGKAIESVRKSEDLSQDACAKELGVGSGSSRHPSRAGRSRVEIQGRARRGVTLEAAR